VRRGASWTAWHLQLTVAAVTGPVLVVLAAARSWLVARQTAAARRSVQPAAVPPSFRTRPSRPIAGGGVGNQVAAAGNLHHSNGRVPAGCHRVQRLGRRPSSPNAGDAARVARWSVGSLAAARWARSGSRLQREVVAAAGAAGLGRVGDTVGGGRGACRPGWRAGGPVGRDLRGWVVGLPGLEPGTSSLSGIEG
jgi:hypothetical protein